MISHAVCAKGFDSIPLDLSKIDHNDRFTTAAGLLVHYYCCCYRVLHFCRSEIFIQLVWTLPSSTDKAVTENLKKKKNCAESPASHFSQGSIHNDLVCELTCFSMIRLRRVPWNILYVRNRWSVYTLLDFSPLSYCDARPRNRVTRL